MNKTESAENQSQGGLNAICTGSRLTHRIGLRSDRVKKKSTPLTAWQHQHNGKVSNRTRGVIAESIGIPYNHVVAGDWCSGWTEGDGEADSGGVHGDFTVELLAFVPPPGGGGCGGGDGGGGCGGSVLEEIFWRKAARGRKDSRRKK